MENLNNIDWSKREKELASSFSDRFKRVWLSYSKIGSICITAFPIAKEERYKIFIEYNVQDFSVENLRSIVLSQI